MSSGSGGDRDGGLPLEGYLLKQGAVGPTKKLWKKRWFRLHVTASGDFKLRYYVSSNEKRLKGSVPLAGAEVSIIPTPIHVARLAGRMRTFRLFPARTELEGYAHRGGFVLSTAKRAYHLFARTREELAYWLEGLQDVQTRMVLKARSRTSRSEPPSAALDDESLPPPRRLRLLQQTVDDLNLDIEELQCVVIARDEENDRLLQENAALRSQLTACLDIVRLIGQGAPGGVTLHAVPQIQRYLEETADARSTHSVVFGGASHVDAAAGTTLSMTTTQRPLPSTHPAEENEPPKNPTESKGIGEAHGVEPEPIACNEDETPPAQAHSTSPPMQERGDPLSQAPTPLHLLTDDDDGDGTQLEEGGENGEKEQDVGEGGQGDGRKEGVQGEELDIEEEDAGQDEKGLVERDVVHSDGVGEQQRKNDGDDAGEHGNGNVTSRDGNGDTLDRIGVEKDSSHGIEKRGEHDDIIVASESSITIDGSIFDDDGDDDDDVPLDGHSRSSTARHYVDDDDDDDDDDNHHDDDDDDDDDDEPEVFLESSPAKLSSLPVLSLPSSMYCPDVDSLLSLIKPEEGAMEQSREHLDTFDPSSRRASRQIVQQLEELLCAMDLGVSHASTHLDHHHSHTADDGGTNGGDGPSDAIEERAVDGGGGGSCGGAAPPPTLPRDKTPTDVASSLRPRGLKPLIPSRFEEKLTPEELLVSAPALLKTKSGEYILRRPLPHSARERRRKTETPLASSATMSNRHRKAPAGTSRSTTFGSGGRLVVEQHHRSHSVTTATTSSSASDPRRIPDAGTSQVPSSSLKSEGSRPRGGDAWSSPRIPSSSSEHRGGKHVKRASYVGNRGMIVHHQHVDGKRSNPSVSEVSKSGNESPQHEGAALRCDSEDVPLDGTPSLVVREVSGPMDSAPLPHSSRYLPIPVEDDSSEKQSFLAAVSRERRESALARGDAKRRESALARGDAKRRGRSLSDKARKARDAVANAPSSQGHAVERSISSPNVDGASPRQEWYKAEPTPRDEHDDGDEAVDGPPSHVVEQS